MIAKTRRSQQDVDNKLSQVEGTNVDGVISHLRPEEPAFGNISKPSFSERGLNFVDL